jgi:hypothetical protein
VPLHKLAIHISNICHGKWKLAPEEKCLYAALHQLTFLESAMITFLPLGLALAALLARFVLGRDSSVRPEKAAPVPHYVARKVTEYKRTAGIARPAGGLSPSY